MGRSWPFCLDRGLPQSHVGTPPSVSRRLQALLPSQRLMLQRPVSTNNRGRPPATVHTGPGPVTGAQQQNNRSRARSACNQPAAAVTQIGGSARGYQRVSAASAVQQSRLRPNRTDSRTVYLYTAEFGVNVLNCRRQGLPGLPWCAGVPVRRACRTGTVPLAVELIEGHGAGGEREPSRDARMPPGSRTGLRDGRAAGRVPADPGRSGAGRRAPARNHRAGRGSGRRPDAREPRGGVGRRGPGSPGYRRVQLSGASRPVVPSR